MPFDPCPLYSRLSTFQCDESGRTNSDSELEKIGLVNRVGRVDAEVS